VAVCSHGGMTEITGPIIDPSHLQGLLERIARLGLTLHSVTPLDAETPRWTRTASDRRNDGSSDRFNSLFHLARRACGVRRRQFDD